MKKKDKANIRLQASGGADSGRREGGYDWGAVVALPARISLEVKTQQGVSTTLVLVQEDGSVSTQTESEAEW